MCGICGTVDPAGAKRESLSKMLGTIRHRGPDDEGIYLDGRVGLGNRRLSIIDLEGGHQPIGNEDNSVWLVFNGEIYNYPELRQTLLECGHTFRTNADTEVLVHLYEEFGEACVTRLRGMFAFAIWDGPQEKLFLARDHLGQKPLFYSQEDGAFHFASEIKAILAVSRRPREMNLEAMSHYLSLRFIPSPHTMLRHVQKLPPSHYLVLQDGRVSVTRYWDFSFREKWSLSDDEYLALLHDRLREAVRSHLISDVPVGAFLSGGMDSSMIVGLMSRDMEPGFKTFSVGVAHQSFNELPYARSVAQYHKTQHVERCVDYGLIDSLPEMIWHLDEPSDPIAACQYQAAALASEHVKVVLGGDGGDELFAGFDRYAALGRAGTYARLPMSLRRQVTGRLLDHLPEGFAYKSLSQKMRWLHQVSMMRTPAEQYAESFCFFRFNDQQKRTLFSKELGRELGQLNSADIVARHFNNAPADNNIDRMLYTDYMTRLPEHSLMLTDRMTMAHGLELRSPFLDHELVSLMAGFPHRLKIRRGELKYILRQVGQEYLPPDILRRDKQGFMFPVAEWFRTALSGFVEDYLQQSYFVSQGCFQSEAISNLVYEHRRKKTDHHVRIWMLLNLAMWHELYIEQKSQEEVRYGINRTLAASKGKVK